MNKKAFTLVELIVVITILAILGTIAFISLQGYSASARDSVRISDVNNMKKVLELYKLIEVYYPMPDDTDFEITYSGALVRTQGVFGDGVVTKVQKISNVPLDPLTKNPYTYSVLNTKKEYEIGAVLEKELSKNVLSKANAADKTGKAYITGTYNGKIAKAETSSTTYILAVPTIINSDISLLDYQEIVDNNTLAYNGGSNIPGSYDGEGYTMTGSSTETIVNNPLVYETNDITDLTDPANTAERETLIKNIQEAYSGTVVADDEGIKTILAADPTDDSTSATLVNNTLDASIPVSSSDNGGDSSLPVCEFDKSTFDNCVFGS